MSLSDVKSVDRDRDELFYREFAAELIRFATGLVGPVDAADVMSAAVLKSLSSPSWPMVEHRRAYLYRAVLNEAKTWKRRTAQRKQTETLVLAQRQTEIPNFRPEVRAAVERLSVQQRAVILLTYWRDLPPRAAAEMLGISEGSVRRHLARARARLREVLDD